MGVEDMFILPSRFRVPIDEVRRRLRSEFPEDAELLTHNVAVEILIQAGLDEVAAVGIDRERVRKVLAPKRKLVAAARQLVEVLESAPLGEEQRAARLALLAALEGVEDGRVVD